MPRIHPTAIVSSDAHLAEDCEVGPYCIVEGPVELGPGCRLISHVRIEGRTFIGSHNVFHPFSCVGAIPQDLKYKGEASGVRIGSMNTIRECVTIHRGTAGGAPKGEGMTILGDQNLIMANCHVAHDCWIGNRVVIANATLLAGHVTIEDDARLGGANLVVQNVRIGKFAFTGAGATIRKDIPPFVLGTGEPVFKPSGINRVGLERANFPAGLIQELKDLYRQFFSSELTQADALGILRKKQFQFPKECTHFVKFIEESTLGVHR